MRFGHSKRSHRIVGCFEIGEQLPESLLVLCQQEDIRAGEVSAQGILSSVELDIYDRQRREYVGAFQSEGSFELLQLAGNISMMGPQRIVNAHALIAIREHGQTLVVGGQLRNAIVHSVEFVLHIFDDLSLERSLDIRTNLPTLTQVVGSVPSERAQPHAPAKSAGPAQTARQGRDIHPRSPQPSTIEPSGSPTSEEERDAEAGVSKRSIPGPASKGEWQQAAIQAQELLERKRTAREEDWESYADVEVNPGDIIIHPRFGECMVVKVEDDTGAWIRLPESKRISKLALSAVKLERAGERGQAKLFKLSGGS